MDLQAFDVEGFRSLANVPGIPVRQPTILTGPNDAGKTALLLALQCLLGTYTVIDADRTFRRDQAADDLTDDLTRRVSETTVTGSFVLSSSEQEHLGLPGLIRLRRRMPVNGRPIYEVMRSVAADPRLRKLDGLRVYELKEVAHALSVDPVGPANRLDSWRSPLRALATAGPFIDEWVPASPELIRSLPKLVAFSSTDNVDPQAQVRTALSASYARILESDDIRGSIDEVETVVRQRLVTEADALRVHIQSRCPDLSTVAIDPTVSFKSGFSNVTLEAAVEGTEAVGLRHAGAGRLRRITLAVWEWTSNLLGRDEGDSRSTIVVYDEPDTHLDYAHQRAFMTLIRSQCSQPGVSMLVATHSLNLIDRVDIADVVHVQLREERTHVERLSDDAHQGIDQYLANVSTSMGLRTSVLLHERCFLAVEGPSELQAIPILFRLSEHLPLQSAGLALISCGGNEPALKVVRFLLEHGRRAVFLLDKDSQTQERTRRLFAPDRLRSYGVTDEMVYFVGDVNELEELFTDDQWAHAAQLTWRRNDGQAWQASNFSVLRSAQKFSDAVIDLLKAESDEAPAGKPDMMTGLALSLQTPDDVPLALRVAFKAIIRVASD